MKGVGSVNNKKIQDSNNFFLPTYQNLPMIDFSIDEIVDFALHRARFHEEIKSLYEKEDSDDRKKKDETSKLFSNYFIPLDRVYHEKPVEFKNIPEYIIDNYKRDKIDEYGFYSLLLVSLFNEDTQRSFVQGECLIFRARLNSIKEIQIDDIPSELLKQTDINFEKYLNGSEFDIPFELIFPFINVTRYPLKNGYVHLKTLDMISIFVSFYRIYLEKKIAVYRQNKIHESEIFDVVYKMYEEKIGAYNAKDRTNWNKISLDDIDSVAHRSFPPCMYNMYKKLKTSHKLFYTGRLQLGLFLKGIGLSMNDSLKLWRDEFSKFGISLDQFDRQYAYNIRYNYGKEGSCKNFSPYTCLGIIRMPPPAIGQTHGCPFIQMKKEACKDILVQMFRDAKRNQRVAYQDKCEALAEKGQKHPQIACTQLYNELHDEMYEESAVRHPCEYFNFSEEKFKEKEEKRNSNK